LLSAERDLQTLRIQHGIDQRNGIIALSVILLIIAGLLYNQFRIKQRANRQLLDLDRLKSNFFTNISDEFRSPVTVILGPIEQLEQNPSETLSTTNVKMIRRNANRVLKMVNQLLDLSKIDGGNMKLEPTEGDVYRCLRSAAASFNSHAIQRNIDFKVLIPQTVLWATYDRVKVENIVYNLLGNAFKFSDDGAVIAFEAEFGERGLFLQVSDTGKGIPKEKLPFIFDRFYQVDIGNIRDTEGTGIGLSLSKDLIDLMDGTITVTSEVGKGTFFTILLPLQEIKTGPEMLLQSARTEKTMGPKNPFQLSKADTRDIPRIMLVEDNDDMRYFLRELLSGHFRLEEAINGKQGLNMAIANPPDLIITDLMMPKMDGITLCKALKNDVHTSHVPIIMLTARAGIENKLEGLETGADDYLLKPFDGSELLVRVKNLILQRQKLRERFINEEVQIDPKKVTVTSIDQKFMERLLNLLETNFSNPDFGPPQMYSSMNMSKSQLHRKVKALTDETPGELLRNFRLKKAAQLISRKGDSVTQVAYQVGFNNLSYFAKCFKALYGVAPSSY
jgi:signal transduction histidine kinase/DNA-binding response OmpR family regulator